MKKKYLRFIVVVLNPILSILIIFYTTSHYADIAFRGGTMVIN